MRRRPIVGAAALLGIAIVYLMMAAGDATPPPNPVVVEVADDDDEEFTGPSASAPTHEQAVRPLVAQYCVGCHRRDIPSGGVVLEGLEAGPSEGDLVRWRKAAQAMRSGMMPPAGETRPTLEELNAFNAWLHEAEFRANCNGSAEPGRLLLRRLNRAEYNNTIRDLTGLSIRPANDFPADDVGYGFDNIGDVLSTSPLLTERHLEAAEKIVDCMFASPDARQCLLNPPSYDSLPYGLRGLLPVRDEANKTPRLSKADLASAEPVQRDLERAGNVILAFADRAYRRPISYDELNRLLRFVESSQKMGDGIEPGLKLALQAILVSPHFLFHIEGRDGAVESGSPHPNHDFELASRLSYFLWSSMPDETLYQLAAVGKLRESRTLRAQVRRLLRDPRSQALVDNFFAQWLHLRNLNDISPDPTLFSEFDDSLRTALKRETELFCMHIIREDRNILEFLDSDYTFVNARLARHYGLTGIHGESFQRVSLAGTTRGGLLTQGSVLAVTSHPTRTSPVKRGRWILENLLGAPIPSPPPGIDDLPPARPRDGALRQRLERHRTDAKCASCHGVMDPLGFGLENFDAVGAWRAHDGGQPIDASGTLAGKAFAGPAELRSLLHSRRGEFARCLSEKMLTYALGRGLVPSDQCAVEAIVRRLDRGDNRISSLIIGVVLSKPFGQRP